jgi:regulatory protein
MSGQMKTLAQAKKSVERLLKIRPRSQKELTDKLKHQEFDQAVIDQTLDYFRGLKLIDDREFARQWIHWRAARPFGINRIRFELKQKGVSQDIIDELLQIFKENVSEEEIVTQLAKRRKTLLKGLEADKLKGRLYGYLLRKGFSPATVAKVLKKI